MQQGLRQGRAAIFSPAIGDYQFELDKTSSSGIAVLTTSHGLHKVSYDIKYTAPNNFVVTQQQFVAYAACQTIFELILFILRNAKQVKLAFSKTLRV